MVESLGDSKHLVEYKTRATVELKVLVKTSTERRPIGASLSARLEREANRIAKKSEEQENGQKALLQQKAHLEEEKLGLEKLKAHLAAEPAVPGTS